MTIAKATWICNDQLKNNCEITAPIAPKQGQRKARKNSLLNKGTPVKKRKKHLSNDGC